VADRLFEGEEAVLHVIERIVAPLGLRVDATSPWVDARLPDGWRVQTNFLNTDFRLPARVDQMRCQLGGIRPTTR
jgi:Flp pilus assembly CpaF family ATPase